MGRPGRAVDESWSNAITDIYSDIWLVGVGAPGPDNDRASGTDGRTEQSALVLAGPSEPRSTGASLARAPRAMLVWESDKQTRT